MDTLTLTHWTNLIDRIRISKLLITAAGTLGLKISAASLGLINGILFARWLGPKEFGVYSILMAAVSLVATITTLGLPMFVVRETASYAAIEKWGLLKGLISTTHKWLYLSFVVIISAVLLLDYVCGVDFSISHIALFSVLFLTLIIAFNLLRSSILRGLRSVIIADIPDLLVKPIVVLLLLVFGYSIYSHADAQRALNIQIAASLSALLLGLKFLRLRLPSKIKHASAVTSGKDWFLGAVPFLGISLIGMLDNQIFLYQLGYLSGPEQAGLFQAANQLVGLIIMGLVAVNVPLQPEFTREWTKGNRVKAAKLSNEATRLGMFMAIIGALVLIPFSEKVLWLFGEQYIESAYALRILVLGQLCNAAAGPCGLLLTMSGYQTIVMLTVTMTTILKLLIGWKLIPLYGVIGAATASSIGVLIWNLILVYFASYKLKISTHIFQLKFKVRNL